MYVDDERTPARAQDKPAIRLIMLGSGTQDEFFAALFRDLQVIPVPFSVPRGPWHIF